MSLGREQNNTRVGAGNLQLYPALFVVEGLIRKDRKSELLRLEREGPVLIAHGNADEFDSFDHGRCCWLSEVTSR